MSGNIHVVSSSISFSGHQLGKYLLNQVTTTKILVAIAPKVVVAWRVAVLGPLTWLSVISYSLPRWDTPYNTHSQVCLTGWVRFLMASGLEWSFHI